MLKKNKQYRQKNKNRIKDYKNKNRQKIRKQMRIYFKKRKEEDLDFLLKVRLRNRLLTALKLYTKTGKIMPSKDYGIDYEAIIKHLKPFPKDLENYEIHHIKPIYTFNFINKDGSTNFLEISKAFSPENHKLLTKEEHRKLKGGELLCEAQAR